MKRGEPLGKTKQLQTAPSTPYRSPIFFPASNLIAVIVAGVLIVAASAQLPGEFWTGLASSGYFQSDLFGFISFTCIYILAILLMAPLSPFALSAGLLFGFGWGSLLALTALNLGSTLAFVIARYLLPRRLAQLFFQREQIVAVAEALRGEAVATIAVLRLNPLVPFNLQNYICGLTEVGFTRYALATLLGAAPFTVVLVYLGHAGRKLAKASGLQVEEWILLLSFAALILALPLSWVMIRRVVKRLRECHKDDKITTESD